MWNLFRSTMKGPLSILRRYLQQPVEYGEWKKPSANGAYNTGISIYNCIAGKSVPLIVGNRHCVTWYTCGPTVYDETHIGHAICYMKCDIIQRILRHHFHMNLVTAMNVTDIDDKIIARSFVEKVQWHEISRRYEARFWDDLLMLGIQKPDIVVRVSDFMPRIVDFVAKLLAKKAAYVGTDGSVYFRNNRPNGKLQNVAPTTRSNFSKLDAHSQSVRVSVQDFALWKCAKTNEPKWDVPWKCGSDNTIATAGRPGWHTECSVMASDIFGNTIDIHAGGIDLKFPHHECEEAQSCAYHNCDQWVNYWIHIGHLVTTDNVKMSKSLKNVIGIKEFLRYYKSDQLRMLCLMSAYNTHIHFTDELLLDAGIVLNRFVSFFQETKHYLENPSLYHCISNHSEILAALDSAEEKIDASLKNNFNTKECILELQSLVLLINNSMRRIQTKDEAASVVVHHRNSASAIIRSGQHFVRVMLEHFGLTESISRALDVSKSTQSDNEANIKNVNLINAIMQVRSDLLEKAREVKDKQLFDVCDRLRKVLNSNGLIIKDRGQQSKSSWHFNDVITRKHSKKC